MLRHALSAGLDALESPVTITAGAATSTFTSDARFTSYAPPATPGAVIAAPNSQDEADRKELLWWQAFAERTRVNGTDRHLEPHADLAGWLYIITPYTDEDAAVGREL